MIFGEAPHAVLGAVLVAVPLAYLNLPYIWADMREPWGFFDAWGVRLVLLGRLILPFSVPGPASDTSPGNALCQVRYNKKYYLQTEATDKAH